MPKLASFLDEAEVDVLAYMSFPLHETPNLGVHQTGSSSLRKTGIFAHKAETFGNFHLKIGEPGVQR